MYEGDIGKTLVRKDKVFKPIRFGSPFFLGRVLGKLPYVLLLMKKERIF